VLLLPTHRPRRSSDEKVCLAYLPVLRLNLIRETFLARARRIRSPCHLARSAQRGLTRRPATTGFRGFRSPSSAPPSLRRIGKAARSRNSVAADTPARSE